jgi:PD-(D/E)XK nuclease superfamily
MKRILREVRDHAFPPKEPNLFSVAGIMGRYENPTSDLLRFFMSPDEVHDLGSLFLRAFFTCLGIDHQKIRFHGVEVRTRVKTSDRKFPDFVISGLDWVLAIENKINAQNENPLGSYQTYVEDYFCGRQHYYSILSRDGRAASEHSQWQPISYSAYCNALKIEFAKICCERPISKWQVLAREFILHLENTLYTPAMNMTQDQKSFVEENLREIGDLKKLAESYIGDILSQLAERLKAVIPGIQIKDFEERFGHHFAYGTKGNLLFQLWFQTPAQETNNRDRKYIISVWLQPLTEAQRERAAGLLARPGHEFCTPPDKGDWVGTTHLINCKEAVEALFELTKEVVELLGNEPSISPAP